MSVQHRKDASETFFELEKALGKKSPKILTEARTLSDKIVGVQSASLNKIWEVCWSKPLFANTKVDIAEGWVERVRPYMRDALAEWGEPGSLLIARSGTGSANKSFEVTGKLSIEVSALSIALKRLYAIQGAAIALRTGELAYKDLPRNSLKTNIKTIQSTFGFQWGPITSLHFLTDLGLALKPDIHVCRTVHFLKICPSVPKNVENPNTKQALLICDAVFELCKLLHEQKPDSDYTVRYVDKVMMEISRQGLLP